MRFNRDAKAADPPERPGRTPVARMSLTGSAPAADIAVVIVNWNGWRDTIAAYESLRRSTVQTWRAIVVDNASTDDSRSELGKLSDRFTLIASDTNTGFAGGVNIGVRAAIERGCEYLFLLNNDAAVRPDTLAKLVAASIRADHRAALGAVVRYKETGDIQYFGSQISLKSGGPNWLRTTHDLDKLKQDTIDVDFVFGAALFCPLPLFQEVGLLDERFFLNYEETDWCYRARAMGARCLVVTSAVVDHVGGASLGGAESPLQAYFLQRNDLLFKEKHATMKQRLRGFVGALRRVVRSLARSSARKPGRIDPTTQALMIAIDDYRARRFGDCPPRVRALAAQARQARLLG